MIGHYMYLLGVALVVAIGGFFGMRFAAQERRARAAKLARKEGEHEHG